MFEAYQLRIYAVVIALPQTIPNKPMHTYIRACTKKLQNKTFIFTTPERQIVN